MRILATLPVVGMVLGASAAASAQDLPPPSTYAQPPPGWAQSYYHAPPPAPPPPPPVQLENRWGVGLRLTSQSVATEAAPDDPIQLGGGGLHVKWRFARSWSLELDLEGVESDPEKAYTRTHGMTTLALAWHLTPGGSWDWFLLAGLGGGEAEISYRTGDGSTVMETYEQTHARFGVGLEKRWNSLGIGAELGVVGIARNGDLDPDTRVHEDLSGGQFNLSATYYF